MIDYITKLQSQSVLFADRPSRLDLQQLELDGGSLKKISINVWRNHAFEPIIALARPYLAYCQYMVDFCLSDYDDSLMFGGQQPADIELLWIDRTRYQEISESSEWLDWFIHRIRLLRSSSTAPIIVATWFDDTSHLSKLIESIRDISAINIVDLEAVCSQAGVKLTDLRSASIAGSPIGKVPQIMLARELACHWIPATIFPPIKVLALDLDNTLHAGVLGEDGIQGVRLTPNHKKLQLFIRALQQRGIFIALVSRNEHKDVKTLFEQRHDYPLRWNDFSAIEISWDNKAAAIDRIAKALRIAPDAILFVDDNPGELASVAAQLSQVHTVYADADASLTRRAIEYYPGLWRWKIEDDDVKRIQDMKANAERASLLKQMTDPSDYFRSLQIKLFFRYDPFDKLGRLADLCQKTNQFNLAIRRLNQSEISELFKRSDCCVASVQMKDRLSDSGVIAVIAATLSGKSLIIEELCISCRAMGRLLEDTLIITAIRDMPLFSSCHEVVFRVQKGERNKPAIDWLAKSLSNDNRPANGLYTISANQIRKNLPPDGITLIKE